MQIIIADKIVERTIIKIELSELFESVFKYIKSLELNLIR